MNPIHQRIEEGACVPSHLVPELTAILEGRPLLATDPRHPKNLKRDVEWPRPTPLHLALDVELLERLLCSELGHQVATVEREPVLGPFHLCLRCGKWSRL